MTTKKIVLIIFVLLSCFSFFAVAQDSKYHQSYLNHPNHPVNRGFNKHENELVFTTGGEWSRIQVSEYSFDWSSADLAYQLAKRNDQKFRWALDLTSQMIPNWLVGLAQSEIEAHISKFINKICERYTHIDSLILQFKDKKSLQKIRGEISNCRNVKILTQLINNSQQQNQIPKLKQINLLTLTNQYRQNQFNHKQQIYSGLENDNEDNGMAEIKGNLKVERLLQTSVVTANFNMGPIPGYTVSVTSTSTTTNGATITSTSWNWGDGSPANTSISSSHIYAFTGTYNITLTVRDSNGNTASKNVSITVPATNNLPSASFRTSMNKEVVFFNATASKSKYGVITSYKWDFGDGTIKNITTSTYTYTYASSGTYNVTLTIVDDRNARGSTSNQITVVANVPPSCNLTVTQIIGFAVFMDSNCTDSDGYIASYSWGWNDSTVNGNTKSISHIYAAEGDYNITLIAYDDNGAVSTQKKTTVHVPTNMPVASFSSNVVKLVVNFNATSSVSPLGSISQFKWNFGDGSSPRITTVSTTSYAYSTATTFNVTLEVTDTAGLTNSTSLNVTSVANAAPTAGFNFTVSGRTVTVTSISTDSDGTISAYKWNFGDSSTNGTNTATATNTYATSGTYNVTLTVVDNDGSSSTAVTKSVFINDAPVASFSFTNNTFLETTFDATSSSDDNGVSSYSWNWGDSTAAGSGSTPNHTFATGGTYNVTLTVTDAQGLTNSISKNVTVIPPNAPPVVSFNYTNSTFLEATFDGTSSTDDNVVTDYSWNWGDSTPAGSGSTLNHTFPATGTYNVTLTVTDAGSLTNSISKNVTVTANAPPVANFSFTNSSFLNASFDASSSSDDNGISSYSWNWNDSSTKGSGSTPSHVFPASGTYSVTLTVADAQGLTNSITKNVTVTANAAPVANFTFSNSFLTISVDGTSSSDDNGVSSYNWNWGDSTAAGTVSAMNHTYTSAGTYNVTLTVTDAQGLTNSMSKNVTVTAPNSAPVAAFTFTNSTFLVATFNASSSTDDKSVVSYSWNWGDSTAAGSGSTPNHTFAATGTYNVTLTVADAEGLTNSVSKNVTVTANAPPVANFTFTNSSFLNASFDASSSSDDNGVVSYSWNWNDSSTAGSGSTSNHVFPASGNYSVTLTVADAQGLTNSITKNITVTANAAPVASFTFNNNTFLTVSFNGTTSTDDYGISSYNWNWGDSTAAGAVSVMNHTYTSAGTYNVTLTVTDAQGLTNSMSKNVTVTAPNSAPVAAFTFTNSTFLVATFNASSSTDDKGVVSYSWNWGDSTAAGSRSTPNHTFAATGTYNVTLTVTDAEGLTNSISKNVTVTANLPPVANFTFTNSSFLNASFDASSSSDDNGIVSYSWNWNDSSTTGSGSTPSHVFPASGNYSVTLTVADAQGLTNSITKNVNVTANAPPVAAFTFNNNTFLTVSFNGTTSTDDYGVSSYNWNFGDLTNGTGSTPNKTYKAAGNYSVTLTVADAQGLTNSITKVIGVTAPNAAPVANFAVNNTDLTALVDASSSTDYKGVVNYTWSWNDSTPNTYGMVTNHTYTTAGNYKITLTVTDAEGLNNSISKSVGVTAPNMPPTAAYIFTTTDLTVSVDGKDSTDDNGINSYTWTWGDGASGDTGRTATHTYAVAGKYLVTLNVTDAKGLWNTTSKNITVTAPNAAPKAAFTYTTSGLALSVDGSTSTDDVGVTSYTWSWGDTSANTTGRTATHTYTTAGSYNVTLTVADAGNLKNSTSKNITVTALNQAPTASFTYTISGLKATVDASASTDDVAVTSYVWDWGDSSATTTTTSKTATHTYANTGNFKIGLTVYDGPGLTGYTSQTVRIK